nr:hypothetical protein [uncultured Mucilaginibacter sp.]
MATTNYRALAESAQFLQNPDRIALSKSFSDELSSISYSDVLYYVRIAMNGVDETYTQRSKDAGEKVKNHLINGGLKDVSFAYQGSVMTNTHIKGYSDIDLLAMSEKFYSRDISEVNRILQDPVRKQSYHIPQINSLITEQNLSVYQGSSLEDLLLLRLNSETILSGVYSIHDLTKPKSIKIHNTNLKRDVDIVVANWYDDIRSIVNGRGENRGIQIYNKELHQVGNADYPFLSISRINSRSSQTSGRLKKMIRFLKNLKAKSTLAIGLNSFEFNAICYDIAPTKYQTLTYYQLVYVLYQQIHALASSAYLADNLLSVDGSEFVFRGKPSKLESLKNLLIEIQAIYIDLNNAI